MIKSLNNNNNPKKDFLFKVTLILIFGALRERKHPATKNFTPHLARFELVAGFSHPRSAMRGPRPGVPAFLITGFSEPETMIVALNLLCLESSFR
uniref:Uncharacterized protein n=1 Tax=Tetranychus urticae TaxID=32264 RepID=T1KH57_TETUR